MPRAEERSGQRERRSFRRNPFVLVGESVRGLVVTAANSEARRGGVQPSMTLADARAVCPGLVSEPHDTARDADVLGELALWLGRYGPRRHTDGTDGLWVETTGVDHLFAGEEAMVRDLVSRCARVGLSARVGVAETYGAAHAMARYCCCSNAPVAIAATGDLEAALARVPVDGLRLTEDAAHLLKRLGLRRIGQLQAVSRIALARRFRDDGRGVRRRDREGLARAVVWRLDQAFGQDDEPKVSIEPEPLRMTRLAFADPLISAEGIESAAEHLVTTLCQALEHQALGALATQLVLYRADGTRAAVDAVASRASHTPRHWLSLLRERLSAVDAGLGIDAVTFAALSTGALPLEQSALVDGDRAEEVRRDGMAQLIDRLGIRVGSTRVLTHHPQESHIPERAERWLPAHAKKRGTEGKRAGGDMRHVAAKMPFMLQHSDAHQSAGHRPSLILERPEPIEVLAELPEGPPAQFRWRHRRCEVRLAEGPERLSPEWWRHLSAPAPDAEADVASDTAREHMPGVVMCEAKSPQTPATDAQRGPQKVCGYASPDQALGVLIPTRTVPRPRDYYVLEDLKGARYWVFREGLYQSAQSDSVPVWFMHGLYG